MESLAGEVESSAGQRDQLERERVEAQGRLEELDREKARVDSEIADLKTKCQQEQKEVGVSHEIARLIISYVVDLCTHVFLSFDTHCEFV